MATFIRLFLLVSFTLFFIYSCNDTGPTIENNNNSGNHAPEIPKNPFPHNDTTGVFPLLTVSWACDDPDEGDTVRFSVYMSNDNPPTVMLADSLLTRSYFVPYLLDTGKVFYWKVVAKDNHGAGTTGPTWKFRTGNSD